MPLQDDGIVPCAEQLDDRIEYDDDLASIGRVAVPDSQIVHNLYIYFFFCYYPCAAITSEITLASCCMIA